MQIVIGEDSVLFREGLARLLEDHGHVVAATAGDAPDALEAVRTHRPDLAILDVRMPPDLADDGARAARVVRSEFPDLGIVLLSQHVETRHSVDLVGAGGFGYLLKDRVLDVATLVDALERIADGQCVIDPAIVAELLRAHRRPARLAELTDRELVVLGLVAQGLSNAGIGERLFISPRTVEVHITQVFAKLGLPDDPSANRRVLAALVYLGSAHH